MTEQGLTAEIHLSEFMLQLYLCQDCPTHKNTLESEEWFCDSEAIVKNQQKRGCFCGACSQAGEEGLAKLYFCTAGAVGERRTFG